MNRRLQLWLGVSACALLGVTTLPAVAHGQAGQGNSQDLDPDGGMANECGEAGGCAEAGEDIESRTADELGDEADELRRPGPAPAVPRSDGGGLSDGDSISGGINDGGLGD